jgi:hypothetical protein
MTQNDPRMVGGRYFNGYWGREYTVEAMGMVNGFLTFRVRWEDGHETTHATAWSKRLGDRVISQPGE